MLKSDYGQIWTIEAEHAVYMTHIKFQINED